MTNEAQDVTVELEAETLEGEVEQGQEAEKQDSEAEEIEDNSPEADDEPEKTVEERLAELERENAGKQKAIDRKTAAYHALQQAHEKKLQELQELQTNLNNQKVEEAPTFDDYETHEEYIDALADYKAKQKVQQERQTYIQQQQQAEQEKIAKERERIVQQHEAEYMKVNPSYEQSKSEVTAFIQTAQIPRDVENAVVSQFYKGNTAQIIDYFGANNGENLDKLQEIISMSPYDAVIEVYKIQQSLKAPVKKEVKPVSAPAKKPSGGGKPKKNLHDGDVLKNLGLK